MAGGRSAFSLSLCENILPPVGFLLISSLSVSSANVNAPNFCEELGLASAVGANQSHFTTNVPFILIKAKFFLE